MLFYYIAPVINILYSSSNSVQWQSARNTVIARVTLLCWRVYQCDQSRILVGVSRYCIYHWFTRLRHCYRHRWMGYSIDLWCCCIILHLTARETCHHKIRVKMFEQKEIKMGYCKSGNFHECKFSWLTNFEQIQDFYSLF